MPFPLPLINKLGLTTPRGFLPEGGLQTKGAAPPPRPPQLRAPRGLPSRGHPPAPSPRHPRRLWSPAPALAGPAPDTSPAPARRLLAPGCPSCGPALRLQECALAPRTSRQGWNACRGPRSCLPARDVHLWVGHQAVTKTVCATLACFCCGKNTWHEIHPSNHFLKMFMYVAAPGLGCRMWGLWLRHA